MEVADERGVAAGIEQAALDLGHRGGGFGEVHRDAQHLGSRARQFEALRRGGRHVGRVGVAHRLDDDGRPPADLDPAHPHADGMMPRHVSIIPARRATGWRLALIGRPERRSYATAATSVIAARAARSVLAMCDSVCAAERNHASNGDGGR